MCAAVHCTTHAWPRERSLRGRAHRMITGPPEQIGRTIHHHSKDGEAVGPHVVVLLIYLEATRLERIGYTARVTAIQKVVGCYTHSGTQTYFQLQ